MDFHSRVTIPSIKNFQLQDQNNNVVLQFGRIGKNQFTMDFSVSRYNIFEWTLGLFVYQQADL